MWNPKACNILKLIAWINLFIYLIAIMYCATVAILSEERYWTSLIIFILIVSTISQILILILLHDLSLDVYSHAVPKSTRAHRSPTGFRRSQPEPTKLWFVFWNECSMSCLLWWRNKLWILSEPTANYQYLRILPSVKTERNLT